MQHPTTEQDLEGHFADGLGEYSTFYGGLRWDYRKPTKLATATVQELDASPRKPLSNEHPSTTSRFANASYDLAAHVPQYKRFSEGLQVAEVPPRTSSLGCSTDLLLEERPPRPPIGLALSSHNKIPVPQFPKYHVPVHSPTGSSQRSSLIPLSSSGSDVPQPLNFKRATTMPTTPPMSNAGS